MATKLLIYDSECAYCRGFVQLIQLLDRSKRICALSFDAPDSQVLLRTQFEDKYGFAMYLFEKDQVSWGQEAARRVIESLSLPRWMARLAFYAYPSLVKLVSWLARRQRRVCGPECAGFPHQAQTPQSAKLQEGALQKLERLLRLGTSKQYLKSAHL